jgi:hypothetical protein
MPSGALGGMPDDSAPNRQVISGAELPALLQFDLGPLRWRLGRPSCSGSCSSTRVVQRPAQSKYVRQIG